MHFEKSLTFDNHTVVVSASGGGVCIKTARPALWMTASEANELLEALRDAAHTATTSQLAK